MCEMVLVAGLEGMAAGGSVSVDLVHSSGRKASAKLAKIEHVEEQYDIHSIAAKCDLFGCDPS